MLNILNVAINFFFYFIFLENTFTVKICKSSRGLGLSISGGRDASRKDPFSQLIQIRKLYPLQPALECGKLALGDVILEVNGISMLGLTNTVSRFLCKYVWIFILFFYTCRIYTEVCK